MDLSDLIDLYYFMIRSHFEAIAAADATLAETQHTFEVIYASTRERERKEMSEHILSNSLLTLQRSCKSQMLRVTAEFRILSASQPHRLAGADELFVLAIANAFQVSGRSDSGAQTAT